VAWAKAYLHTKWHLDPFSHLATTDMGQKLGGGRNQLKFAAVPQTPEPISAISGPKFAILWGHVEEVFLLNNFSSDCQYMC